MAIRSTKFFMNWPGIKALAENAGVSAKLVGSNVNLAKGNIEGTIPFTTLSSLADNGQYQRIVELMQGAVSDDNPLPFCGKEFDEFFNAVWFPGVDEVTVSREEAKRFLAKAWDAGILASFKMQKP